MAKTLGEFRIMIRNQAGGAAATHIYDPVQFHDALKASIYDMIHMAVDLKSPRLIQHDDVDLVADEAAVRIPPHFVATYGISAIADDGTERPYNYIGFIARAQPGEPYFASAGGTYEGYWLEHRTVHLSPKPSTFRARKLRIYGWQIPPMPLDDDKPVAVPEITYRYLVTNAVANHLLPPPAQNVLDTASRQLKPAKENLELWLQNAVRDVNPGPVVEGDGHP